jgi:cell division protein FtsB
MPGAEPAAGTGRPAVRATTTAGAGRGHSGRVSITGRAIALVVVLLLLTISYASSLRIYFAQEHEIAATRALIADREARIVELQAALARWDDADYVRTQARDRLGWVVPGEIGFRVVDEDGNPLGGGAEIDGPAPAPVQAEAAWWSKVWGGVAAADQPAPVKEAQPKKKPTVTVSTKPSR